MYEERGKNIYFYTSHHYAGGWWVFTLYGDMVFSIDLAAILFIGMVQPLIILSQTGADDSVNNFKQEMWEAYARRIKKLKKFTIYVNEHSHKW